MIMIRSTELHIYSKTLYWTLLNYFSVYRSLSTGMDDSSDKAGTTKNQENVKILLEASQKVFEVVNE